jgi:MFS family permease
VQPTTQRHLHASFTQVQWTSTGYLIAVASLLVFAGRLGDRYGHVALGVFLFSRLDRGSTAAVIGGCALVMGAGFGVVTVTATAVVVRHASVENAGVAGGLQQTAMNVGPTLGVATATMLMTLTSPGSAAHRATGEGPRWAGGPFMSAMGPTLAVLAAAAVLGALPAIKLSGGNSSKSSGN